ncbi:hypothetical protein TTHERM_000327209 (macronuclear) [Tetrahymena thermophila SB210]|uniref:Uncharacterized protein n=1 Tax=Tetrahymena thermophila (strain SB210) TaxID=312017 RepID=W7XEZ2_TETTS|nr:hypothetical protein TTHERM_000327209 [Tetrahymena thermophila SB210]EWS71319.1 hypothetical protein TTHERM_000327209 [Tetrahymena thermophila SB210]|eukprot:XP_012656137.1 hypothetical protein TTHERM_000327209 [Tetrahymena thermophila SB210]
MILHFRYNIYQQKFESEQNTPHPQIYMKALFLGNHLCSIFNYFHKFFAYRKLNFEDLSNQNLSLLLLERILNRLHMFISAQIIHKKCIFFDKFLLEIHQMSRFRTHNIHIIHHHTNLFSKSLIKINLLCPKRFIQDLFFIYAQLYDLNYHSSYPKNPNILGSNPFRLFQFPLIVSSTFLMSMNTFYLHSAIRYTASQNYSIHSQTIKTHTLLNFKYIHLYSLQHFLKNMLNCRSFILVFQQQRTRSKEFFKLFIRLIPL